MIYRPFIGSISKKSSPGNDRFWPISEVFDFPKQDVQATAFGKSCHSGRAAIPDPFWPLPRFNSSEKRLYACVSLQSEVGDISKHQPQRGVGIEVWEDTKLEARIDYTLLIDDKLRRTVRTVWNA